MATKLPTVLARCGLLPLLLLLAALMHTTAGQRIQCPWLGKNNCTANDGLAFFDGCKAIACIDWQSAVINPRSCPPATTPDELERCDRLSELLVHIRNNRGPKDTQATCPQFADVDICAIADRFFNYNDGCNYHQCDGSGGRLQRTNYTCPDAVTTSDLFYCASSYYAVVREYTNKYACSAQTNNAERICEVMFPGYRFGDVCFGSADFVCGPDGTLLTRPSPWRCPLRDASDSLKCREVANEVANLLSDSRGFTCPELHDQVVCTAENIGFVYNDGCNAIMCTGEESGMNEGRACKETLHESQVAGLEFCARQTAAVRRKLAESRRHEEPCLTAEDVCTGDDPEGETYYDGCQYCTCLSHGRAQCTRRECNYFFGTDSEFAAYCQKAAHKLP